jgi:uncharacterized protein
MPETLTCTSASPRLRFAAVSTQIPVVDYLVLGDEPHLQANACTSCGAIYFDRRNACARCGKLEFAHKALATTGVVRSFTIVFRAAPNVPVPYISSVIELDGGGVVKANLKDVEPDPKAITLGMPVRLVTFTCGTDDEGSDAVAFGFAPV